MIGNVASGVPRILQMCMHIFVLFVYWVGGETSPPQPPQGKKVREVYALRFVRTSSYEHWLHQYLLFTFAI